MNEYERKKEAVRANIELAVHEIRLEACRDLLAKVDRSDQQQRIQVDDGFPLVWLDQDIVQDAIRIMMGRLMHRMDSCRDAINRGRG